MGVVERKEREKQQRREQILDAGENLILTKGLDQITMDDIARECELSKGTLYLYFKNKEEIFLSLAIKSLHILNDMFFNKLEKTSTALEKMKAIGLGYYDFYENHKNRFKIINHSNTWDQNESFTLEEVNNPLFNEFITVEEKIWSTVTDIIKNGITEGTFRSDIQPFEIVLILWSTSNGIIQLIEHVESHLKYSEATQALEGLNSDPQKMALFCFFLGKKGDSAKLLFSAWSMILSSIAIRPEEVRSIFAL
ncbi:MAG: TetR/AcrR family transcriptional regulator [Chitinivibrionales bacterium]|nr:TetR/AcrR family transcriptional regulator [Chitinivibrionales bacterium]